MLGTLPATEYIQFLGRLPAGGFVDDGISMVDGLGLVPNHRHRRGARHAGPLEIADGCSAEVMGNAAGTTGGTEVQVRGYQSKDKICDPICRGSGRDITFPDGTSLFMGSSGTGAPRDGADTSEPAR
jgi:hypothetical protein